LEETYKELSIHPMGESEEIHDSLIIRVNQCSSVVPILFLGLFQALAAEEAAGTVEGKNSDEVDSALGGGGGPGEKP
jgi:hypothetical protein